ncbi:hypothetical protein [Pseudomonas sp.]|uniref:hypothetical protein n=1 Tax=Pseudomonas sp. TaxID=306 RepID=UPI003F2BA453
MAERVGHRLFNSRGEPSGVALASYRRADSSPILFHVYLVDAERRGKLLPRAGLVDETLKHH